MMMAIHAHMHRNEIIGFLSGFRLTTKTNKKVIIIHEAQPTQATEIEGVGYQGQVDYSKNVEMEPESAQRTCEAIKASG